LIQKKEVSKEEVIESAITTIEMHNPKLNAVVYKQYDEARGQVNSLPDGSLHGVPMLLKDLLGEQSGHPSTSSCAPLADVKATEDAEIVARFKNAGLNIIGRTNTPQLGIYANIESEFRGPGFNPWNTAYTPGGSSGGSASAVAAGMVPIAHGGDGGGSIRIPASHCGLVGLKPSRGRQPTGPFRGERWNGLVAEGVLTRTVRDTALALDISASGIDLGAPYSSPAPDSFLKGLEKKPKKLKIAFTAQALFGSDTHSDNQKALKHSIKLLQDLGHEVVEDCPKFDKEGLIRAYYLTVSAGVALGVLQIEEKIGRKCKESELEMSTWALNTIGNAISSAEYVYNIDLIHRETRSVATFFTDYDLFLTPTTAHPPALIGQFKLTSADRMQIKFLKRFPLKSLLNKALESLATKAICATPNTMLFNQTGQPAISVPLYWNENNLPIGSQLVGGFGQEKLLLQVAAQLEEAQPWIGRYSGIEI
jgi:amidase